MMTYRPVGDHLREWRQRRRLSQLDLALEAEISQKHLSFIESGRAVPSRDMVLNLAARLDLPLRARNAMLLAAGYAPHFPERSLDDPALRPARAAIDLILKGHEPYPALAIDRHWRLVAANDAVAPLLSEVAEPALLAAPINVLRLSLHPAGLAPQIVNLAEWRDHLLERLRQQIALGGDPVLIRLMAELLALPAPENRGTATDHGGIAVPLRLRLGGSELSFISTTTLFGTPLDVTLTEIALETFFPADAATAAALSGRNDGAR
jgi:transcriptional regulator with XRE-family HTH domain